MRKTNGIFRFALLALIILTVLIISLSGIMVGAQSPSPTVTPSAVSPSPSAPPLPSISPSLTPGASVGASPISPSWTAPALSTATPPADLSSLATSLLPSVVSVNVDITTTDFTGQSSVQPGAGSGWVIDTNGLIVTNAHVVEGAQNINVSFSDGKNYPAQQVVADPVTDLAVIKINATGLPALKVGDSSNLKQGMQIMAIGNALGEGLSVTAGWVSRLGASLTVPGSGSTPTVTLFGLIGITAPINPGNSGGPLFNMLGEVVGITNVKLVTTGVENVGFAISTKSALPIIQQLIDNGRVTRPYMGVSIADVDASIASLYGLAVNSGALITDVDASGPAAAAGLQAGDVIVKIDNTTITSAADAIQAILSSKIGQQVTVTYYRDNTQSTAQVTLATNPSS